MEQYTQNETRPVKEKSVYLLHLDGPRILVLSALVIGLLTLAVLVGMKINNGAFFEKTVSQDENLLEQPQGIGDVDSLDPMKDSLSPVADAQNNLQGTPDNQGLPQDPALADKSRTSPLPLDNSIAIEPDVKPIKPAPPVKKAAKVAKKTTPKKTSVASATKKNKDVQPVSYSETDSTAVLKGFVIQVASYDSLDKAKREVSLLKQDQYDAFYDKSKVDGRNYFRVRIGPLDTRDQALQMLDEIQQNTRYEDSYIVRN